MTQNIFCLIFGAVSGAVSLLMVGRHLINHWWRLKRDFYLNIGEQ